MLLVASSCWGKWAPWTSAGGECVESWWACGGRGRAERERRGQGLGQTGPGQERCLGLTPHLTDPPSLWPTLTKPQYQEDEKQSQEVAVVHGVRRRLGTEEGVGQGRWRHLFLGSLTQKEGAGLPLSHSLAQVWFLMGRPGPS